MTLNNSWCFAFVINLATAFYIELDEILKDSCICIYCFVFFVFVFAVRICQCHGTSQTLDPWKISAGRFSVKMPSVIGDEHGSVSPTEQDQE